MQISRMDIEMATEAVEDLLAALDIDTNQPGLAETPARYVKFLVEALSRPKVDFKTFEEPGADEMIVQGPIPFTSLCEHHTLPFLGHAWVGYLPAENRVLGLSKLARCVKHYAAGLNTQERITAQVALRLHAELKCAGVGVMLRAEHLCMRCRGVRVDGVKTISSKLLGEFKTNPSTKAEFFRSIELLPG